MSKSKRSGGPSKMQMVRDSLQALGQDAKPKMIQAWIREKGGGELSTTMISSYKNSILKKESGGAGKRGRPAKSGGGHITINDLNAVKSLIDRFGVSKLSDLIKLMG